MGDGFIIAEPDHLRPNLLGPDGSPSPWRNLKGCGDNNHFEMQGGTPIDPEKARPYHEEGKSGKKDVCTAHHSELLFQNGPDALR